MMGEIEIALRLGAATLVGAMIGINRDLHHKPSGLRTLSLVSLGAASAVVLVAESSTDPSGVSRIMQGVITGIGFLGAGVIVHEATTSKVHGLTTAAAIWVTACLGAACGLGAWRVVGIASALVALVLVIGGPIEKLVHRLVDKGRKEQGTDSG